MNGEQLSEAGVEFTMDSTAGRSREQPNDGAREQLLDFKVELVQALNPQSEEFKKSGIHRLEDEDADDLWSQIQGALHVRPVTFDLEQRLTVLAVITEAIVGYTAKSGFASGKLAEMVKKIEKI